MMRMPNLVLAAFSFMLCYLAHAGDLPIEEIKLPPGFKIEVLARVDNAREMALGAKGTLFVGSMQAGKVYALQLKPPGPPVVTVIASGLKMPVGVAFHRGALYVSSIDRILRLDNIEDHIADPPKPVVVDDHFPEETHHGWKFIAFRPDGQLFVPVGAPGIFCDADFERYANIQRMNADGSG